MKIVYTPQLAEFTVDYSFKNETITASIGGASDSVDFSSLTAGRCRAGEIETSLPRDVFRGAERTESGELTIWLLNPYPERLIREDDESDQDYAERRAEWQRRQEQYEEIV
ncbi:hypothetical protein [Salinicola aestuarinus]|uniref:hypothetical protein n=1 Tax=Salinicola aestuarinus TaxID=1949082 RepID=UPI000DA15767|nr:hypothetical protein [Salinicola aestuarinus]